MTEKAHKIYISTLVSINLAVLTWLIYQGYSYYSTPIVDRFFHEDHKMLKPSGPIGHGYGIVGTLLILIGVFSYMARKKFRSWDKFGRLKYWLEFHIFLCTLGPLLVLFHTAFKFGGLVSVSFWSMVAVVLSGVIGRFIYLQIPRTIEGRELNLQEAKELKISTQAILKDQNKLEESKIEELSLLMQVQSTRGSAGLVSATFKNMLETRNLLSKLKEKLKEYNLAKRDQKEILSLFKKELNINNKIERLLSMQKLFRYWHVAHLPFALIMLIIMVIHVVITLMFGYRWIF